MATDSVLLRCSSCRTVNRIPLQRLQEHPRCGKCGTVLEYPRSPIEINGGNFNREILEHPGLVLLFFWASWCAHCRGMFPIMEDLARQKAGIIKVGMINTERDPALASRFSIMSVPRLTLYRNGAVLDELDGAVSRTQLDSWLRYNMGRPPS